MSIYMVDVAHGLTILILSMVVWISIRTIRIQRETMKIQKRAMDLYMEAKLVKSENGNFYKAELIKPPKPESGLPPILVVATLCIGAYVIWGAEAAFGALIASLIISFAG